MVKKSFLLSGLFATALLMTASANAQTGADNYPTRTIRVVVPISAGTTTDIVARTISERLSSELRQSVIVENKQGAGGTLAAKVLTMADPDGYTILMVNSQHAINPWVYKSLPYDTLKDFAGIALVAESPSAVIASPHLGVTTIKELIDLAKRKPGSINYASSGIGSQTHLAGAYFASQAGIELVHVPYRDSSPIIADLIAGRVQLAFAPVPYVLGQVQQGKLRILGVTSRDNMKNPIAAPSVSSAGIPGYEYNTWFGFLAPAQTPKPILERLATALQAAVNDPTVKKKLAGLSITPRTLLLRDFDNYIEADVKKQEKIVKDAKVEPH
ncbi:MAG: tripartite tricarboxylate transporter substrate binding protein [Pseudolabrys sp.]|nr:tripartite tricarboxylate transporter substrate binding protein [Pseudolabrys sp.]